MKRKIVFSFLSIFFFAASLVAQNDFKSEDELKEKANELFEKEEFVEAEPLFAQLLSLYPQDANYNYKYGACLLAADADKEKPMSYLEFAITKSDVDPLAFYYLAKGNHLNYDFGKAVKYYSRFKTKASSDLRNKYQVDHQIEMCKNGNQLLSKLNEVQVLDRQVVSEKDFFRIYELEGINGKLIAKPADFKSKYDLKVDEKSVIYLPNDAKEVYYSSYGKKGEAGLDIYKSIKLGDGNWSEGVSIGESINTSFDEDYPFIHPDGKTLYFASKGHNSMGGYDLFKSTYDIGTGLWSAPENLDFAFCSTNDDLLFVTDKDQVTAYFASNRSNVKGQYTVYKVLVERKPVELSVIQGKFIAENNPELTKAKITVIDKATNKTIGVYETNKNGEYNLEILDNGGTYQFNIETTSDAPIHTGVVNIPKQEEFEVLGQELRLVGEGNDQQLVIKNIFDGTTAQNSNTSGPQVSANVLRSKANLDVNFSANQLASLEEKAEVETSAELIEKAEEVEKVDEVKIEPVPEETVSENAAVDVPAKAVSLSVSAVALKENFASSKKKQSETINNKQQEVDNAYSEAIGQEKNASEKFTELAALKNNQGTATEVEALEKEAKELALKAVVATETAQLLNEELIKEKNNLSQYDQIESDFNNNLQKDELAAAELQLKQLNRNSSNANEVITDIEKSTSEELLAVNSSIETSKAKLQNFEKEESRISSQISDTEAALAKAKDSKKSELQEQLDALNLDLKDIKYQANSAQLELDILENESKALAVKNEQLAQTKSKLSSTNNIALTAEDKSALLNQIQSFKNNNQVAYQGEKSGDLTASLSTKPEVVTTLDKEHSAELKSSDAIEDVDLRNARKLQVYDNWINELEVAMIAKEVEIGSATDQSEREALQDEVAAIQREIDLKTVLRDQTEETTVSGGASAIQIDSDLVDDEFEETEEAPVPQSLAEVDDLSVIPEDHTNFKYDQTYKFGNQRPSQTMGMAKKALFEAREISIQAEKARDEGYSLPTPEERSAAFDRANELEQKAEEKQLEAANYFADYNKNEYEINRRRIFNANQFEDEFESDALDLANLLAEEGQVYFNDAAQIRREVDPSERLSQKEVKLQKAYDYEMLALKKQRQAMMKISLVDDQYLKEQGTSGAQGGPVFVQTITDAKVLNVKDPVIAQQVADSLYASNEELKKAAEVKLAESESLPVGTQRDEAIVEYENMQAEIEQNKTQAAIYYERKKQLESGVTSGKVRFAEASDGITSPVYKNFVTQVNIDTVDISEERQALVLNSKPFADYNTNKQNRDKVAKEASSEYSLALSLSSDKQKLERQAIIIRNQAELENDETEKQRLIKSAEVIDQKVALNNEKIDSLNTLIKVKNYLVSTSDQKMNASIANLTEVEKREIIQLSSSSAGAALGANEIAAVESNAIVNEKEAEASSQETSQGTESSASLPTESNQSSTTPEIDVEIVTPPKTETQLPEETASTTTTTEVEPTTEAFVPVIPEKTEEVADKTPEKEVEKVAVEPVKTKEVETATVNTSLANVNEVPRQLKQAIFINLRPDESAYNKNKPIPVSTDLPEGLVFKVQVGAFRNPIPQDLFRGFAPLYAEKVPSGITRYTAGLFKNETTAIEARNEIRKLGYPDAFVVAFMNGKRISIAQARGGNPAAAGASEANFNASNESSNPVSSTASKVPLSSRFNEADVATVIDANNIEKVYYTVQIGVFSKPVKAGVFNYEQLNVVELPNGLIRYNAGVFESAIKAADLKNTIQSQIPDAFVTAYKKGSRISLNEASKMKNTGQ